MKLLMLCEFNQIVLSNGAQPQIESQNGISMISLQNKMLYLRFFKGKENVIISHRHYLGYKLVSYFIMLPSQS